MNRVIIYISAIFLITSCGANKETKQKKELEKLALEVMEVHDRSMPEHGKLFGYKKKLLAIESSINDSIIKTEITNTIIEMEKADKDMMDWMHQYKEPDEFLPFEEKKTYYIDQKEVIAEVETRTNQLIEKAKQFIDKYRVDK